MHFKTGTAFSFAIIIFLCGFVKNSQQSRRVRDVSSGNGDESGKIASFAMKALGSFKSFMKEGSNDLGIPKLDPVHMDNFNYSLDNSPVGFKMEIVFESPALLGLSSYELNGASELRGSDGTTNLQMTIVFPVIQIRGRYTARGNMFQFFNLQSSGDFEIIGSSQVLAAEAKLRPVNQTLFVDYITSQFVGGRVKSQFANDATNSGFPGLMPEFLSSMGTHVFDTKLKAVITTAMNDYMKEWLNGAFSSVSIPEILGHSTQPVPATGGVTYAQPQQQQNQPPPTYNNNQQHITQPQILQSNNQIQSQQSRQINYNQQQTQSSPSSNFQQYQPFHK